MQIRRLRHNKRVSNILVTESEMDLSINDAANGETGVLSVFLRMRLEGTKAPQDLRELYMVGLSYREAERLYRLLHDYFEDDDEEDEDQLEPCDVVGSDCLAPAGYLSGDGVIHCVDTRVEVECCSECGCNACENCRETRGDQYICLDCLEDDYKEQTQ